MSVRVNCGSVETCSVCYSMCRAFKVTSERGMVAGEMSSIRLDDFQKKMVSTSKSAAGLFDPFLNLKTNIKLLQFRENIFGMLFVGSQCHLIHSLIYIFGAYPLFVLRKAVYRLKVHWKLQRPLALVLRVRF